MSTSERPLTFYLAKSWVRTTQFILSIDQKNPTLGNTWDEAEEMTQSIKCLMYKQVELSSSPHTYVNSLTACTCNPRPGKVETEDPWGSLLSHQSQTGHIQVSKQSMESNRRHWRLIPDLHMSNPPTHAIILTYMYTHIHKHVHMQTHRMQTVEK